MNIVVTARQLRIYLYVFGGVIVTILGIIFPQAYVRISAFWPFGYSFIVMLAFIEVGTWVWQGNSPSVITKRGYWSINRKDIHFKPLHKKTNGGEKKIGELCIMFVGGIDYKGINPRSTSDYPMLIFPSIYLKKYGLSYAVDCNLVKFMFSELSPSIRHYLGNKYGSRIKEKTIIFFGATSTIDGTATPENDNLLETIRVENEYVKKLEEINGNLHKELKKLDERKTKKFFIKEAGNFAEED